MKNQIFILDKCTDRDKTRKGSLCQCYIGFYHIHIIKDSMVKMQARDYSLLQLYPLGKTSTVVERTALRAHMKVLRTSFVTDVVRTSRRVQVRRMYNTLRMPGRIKTSEKLSYSPKSRLSPQRYVRMRRNMNDPCRVGTFNLCDQMSRKM